LIPYADTRSALHDPIEVANFPLTELDRYVACLRDTMSPAELAAIAPQIQALYDAILGHAFATDDMIVPSGSLFIEALPGTAPVLEDFKLLHRALDVTKAAAEVRGRSRTCATPPGSSRASSATRRSRRWSSRPRGRP